jgi:hypothetical protein
VDFTNHPAKQTIDRSIDRKINKVNQSIISIEIDYRVKDVHSLIGDSTLELPFVKYAIDNLGEGKVRNIVSYVQRKSNLPGHAFIAICKKEIGKKV